MSESWGWHCLDDSGEQVTQAAPGVFPTQAEAEAWLSESWEELADAGVASVSLRHEGEVVYGPMPLDPA